MVDIFKYIDKFFISLTNYLTYNHIFLIFGGLFLLTAVLVFISTSRSYESKLIRAIDHFNTYFINNPQINEDNLVTFNAKMKASFVPKQLRKSWQQFVLYRERKASEYMSFDTCVTTPIRNSTFTRDVKTMNLLAWIFSICAFVLNCYYCFETIDLAAVLRNAALTPALILLLNYIIQIFLSLRHSAIVSDLSQNYQYFEANMDKATETLPEYVDYEVLFDKNEIKKGIPILYAYLQKRAEQEQRELELARLKNVQHEKFNFDDQGLASSLVLERAMQEAENYITERKKYMQDIEQINADMTQEDMNYREITKEYNRQMQVSRETFANFKAQLEDVSSSIEANYLKKQQQQELDRQRNLERDFDTATERHKKVIEDFHKELDAVDKLIATSKKKLENAMKSEFETYSGKVYDEAKEVVEQRDKEYHNKMKQDIVDLEERIVTKDEELEHLYEVNQAMNDKLLEAGISFAGFEPKTKEEPEAEPPVQEYKPLTYEPSQYVPAYEKEGGTYQPPVYEPLKYEEPIKDEETNNAPVVNLDELKRLIAKAQEELSSIDDGDAEIAHSENVVNDNFEEELEEDDFAEEPEDVKESIENQEPVVEKKKAGRPRKIAIAQPEPKKSRGRPRKTQSTSNAVTMPEEIKKGRGRPKKVNIEEALPVHKQGRGRPRKVETQTAPTLVKAGRGRPKKEQTSQVNSFAADSKGRGRPRKDETKSAPAARKVGRPKKVESVKLDNIKDIKDIDAYLKEIDNAIALESAKFQESAKELDKKSKLKGKR